MGSILNNLSAMAASRQLNLSATGLSQTIQRLTTGKRINTSVDDAAGLAISSKLGASIAIAGQANRNANDGVSYLQVADGALDQVSNLLTRATQLAQQAQTGTISNSNRADLNAEFQNILTTIQNIGQATTFNGQNVFSTQGTTQALSIQAGDYGSITVNLGSICSTPTTALGMAAGPSTSATAAGSAAALAATSNAGSGIGYWVSAATASALQTSNPSDPNASAASAAANLASTDWFNSTGNPVADLAGALVSANAYVKANPNDPNGWATAAAIQYQVSNPPPFPVGTTSNQSNNAAAAAAATAATGAGTSLLSAADASVAASQLSLALESVSTMRAQIGAGEEQLNATSSVLGVQSQNLTTAQSGIQDANIANEVVNLTKYQILNQTGTTALAKANTAAQQILTLLQ